LQLHDDSFIYLVENEGITKEMSSRNHIEETSVADLVSHLLGTPIVNEHASRDSFPKGTVFNKASANLFLVVDGLGSSKLFSIYFPINFSFF
jgi:hypothetical protein